MKTFIIAEAGVNHNGSLEMALQLIDIAVEAGVDAIKFQTFNAESLVSEKAPKANYQKRYTDTNESQLEMLKKLELSIDDHHELINYCKTREIQFLSTPFDLISAELLIKDFDMPKIKISSGDITNAPLLLKIAQAQKAVILSTGMSTLGEIEEALGVLAFGYSKSDKTPSWSAFREAYFSEEGQSLLLDKVILLHCTTEYPAPYHEVNLLAMDTLKKAFNLPVGFSDHTEGIAVPIAAVAKGAATIEKHFTLDRNLPGPDHKASLEPDQLKLMVESIRQVEKAMGSAKKLPSPSEIKNKDIARKSLIASKDIKIAEKFSSQNITIKRPGNGISPMYYWDWMEKSAERDYGKGDIIE